MKNLLNYRKIQHFLLVVFLLLMAVGCVSKAKHQELVNNYEDLAEQKKNLEKSCDENIEKLTGQLAAVEEKTASLKNQREKLAREKEEEAAALQETIFSLESKLAGEQARVSKLENALRIEVVDKLMFDSGSAKVTREGSRILAKIVPTLIEEADKEILVIGHTDDLPPSSALAGKYPSNWELSAARAASIVHILTWNYKISPSRMMIQGAAQYHPLTPFDRKDKSARKTNRVVEIILRTRDN